MDESQQQAPSSTPPVSCPRPLDAYPEIMTADEVAEYLRLSVKTVRTLVRRGDMTALPHTHLRIARAAVQAWVAGGRKRTRELGVRALKKQARARGQNTVRGAS